MATTPVSKVIGVTAASGAQGFTGAVAALNTAVAAAVTTAQAVTGAVVGSIAISPATLNVDANTLIFEFYQTITYTIVT